jgi:NADH-quinone oxidoreductase subunit N
MFNFFSYSSFFYYNLEIYLLFIISLLIIFCMGKGLKPKSRKALMFLTKHLFVFNMTRQILMFSLFLLFICYFFFYSLFDKQFLFYDLSFLNNNFISISKILVLLSFFFLILFSIDFLNYELILKSFEYIVLLILSLFGLFCLISSNDFLTLYISIEFQSLALYVLAALKQNSLFSIEAGLKYFILGTFSSGLLLFGTSLLYGITGTLNFIELDSLFQFELFLKNDYLFKLGLLFFFSALMFKFSAAPFHMWSPDVYHGSPTILTFFFSLTPKLAFLAVFIRLTLLLFSPFEAYFQFLFFLSGLFSLIIGSLASIYQIKIKRVLAYSSISNIGYILMGLCIGQVESLASSFLFFFFYIFAVSSIFLVLLGVRYFSNNFEIRSIFEFMGLLNFNFVISMISIFGLFSLLGLPPLAGFFAKFYLFMLAVGSEFFFFLYFSILSSIFSAVIYLRIVRLILFNKYNNIFFFRPVSFYISLVGSFLLLINFLFFFFPTNFFIIVFNVVIGLTKSGFIANFVF